MGPSNTAGGVLASGGERRRIVLLSDMLQLYARIRHVADVRIECTGWYEGQAHARSYDRGATGDHLCSYDDRTAVRLYINTTSLVPVATAVQVLIVPTAVVVPRVDST